RNATRRSWVNTPARNPPSESFTRASASSTLSATATARTGPYTSRCHISLSDGTSRNRVGSTVVPSRVPPLSRVAPASTAASIELVIRGAVASPTTGATRTAGLYGSPVDSARTAAASASTNSAAISRCTTTRCTVRQDCPVWYVPKVAIRCAAPSRSVQSARTTAAAFPPSSNTVCLRGAQSATDQPAAPDPVKDTTGSLLSRTSSN